MKRIVSLFIVLSLLASMSCNVFASDTVDVYVNGRYLGEEQKAIIENGRTLAPLRAICEALKCEVVWNNDTKVAQIKNEVTIIAVQVNNNILTKVDREDSSKRKYITLDVPPVIYNGRTMVPLRAISEALYAEVSWDGANRRVDVKLEFDYIGEFNEHNLAEVRKDGKYGYINIKREVAVPIIYDDIWRFSEGLAGVRKDGKEGFVNTVGEVVVPIVYDSVMYFKEGAVKVKLNKKWGYVNNSGEALVPIIYDGGNDFSEGLVAVKKGNKWGYANLNGELSVPIIYDEAEAFKSGIAKVKKNGKWGYIDGFGNVVIPIMYDSVSDFDGTSIQADLNGKIFRIDKSGKILG